MPIFKRSVHRRNRGSSSSLQQSILRYRQAFSRARAFRFWRAGASVAATSLAMTLPLAIPNAAQAQFPASFDLSSLDGTNGFMINGVEADDRSGISVSDAGDINGDGIDDVIIGAFLADPNGNTNAGQSYVVFGRSVPSVLKGDVDRDGDIDFEDIGPLISVLQSGVFQAEADCDCNTVIEFADIPAFIAILQEQ